MTLTELQALCDAHMTMGQPAGNVEVKGLMAVDLKHLLEIVQLMAWMWRYKDPNAELADVEMDA